MRSQDSTTNKSTTTTVRPDCQGCHHFRVSRLFEVVESAMHNMVDQKIQQIEDHKNGNTIHSSRYENLDQDHPAGVSTLDG